jgi:hypothetical protein
MSSEAQLKANRENSKHSSGPSSPESKKKVSLNAMKHGFAAQTCLIPEHEIADYVKHFKAFRSEYRPEGPTEEFLVQSLAELSWSAQQIRAQVNNIIALSAAKPVNLGETSDPQIVAAVAQFRATDHVAPKINLLGIYEQRKMRLFAATRKELIQIQAERKAAQKTQLEEAARLRKLCKANRQPGEPEWQPAENGFVCSLEEIDRYIACNERFNRPAGTQKMAA